MNKLVGIVPRILESPTRNEFNLSLDINWIKFVEASGFVPVIIPVNLSEYALDNFLEKCDGFLLTGGGEIAEISKNLSSEYILRDQIEEKIFFNFKDKPIFAVCRGMQKIAALAGYSIRPVEGHVRTRHNLKPSYNVQSKDTRLNEIADILSEFREVNSFHDYGIISNYRSTDLKLQYLSSDGYVECFILAQNILGIMWHPERCEKQSVLNQRLFKKWMTK